MHDAGRSVGCHPDRRDDPDHRHRAHQGHRDAGRQSHRDADHPWGDDRVHPDVGHQGRRDDPDHPDVGHQDRRDDPDHPCEGHPAGLLAHPDAHREHPGACRLAAAEWDDPRRTAGARKAAAEWDDPRPRRDRGVVAEGLRTRAWRPGPVGVPEEPADEAHRPAAYRQELRAAARGSA